MSLPLFTETTHCTSRLKCRLCQDPGAIGEQFRTTLAKVYTMPGPGAFPCPFGLNPPPVPPPAPIPPLPRDQWPLCVKAFSLLRADADAGVGDTVQRLAAKFGGEWIKEKYTEFMGGDCGCADRQARLNLRFPY